VRGAGGRMLASMSRAEGVEPVTSGFLELDRRHGAAKVTPEVDEVRDVPSHHVEPASMGCPEVTGGGSGEPDRSSRPVVRGLEEDGPHAPPVQAGDRSSRMPPLGPVVDVDPRPQTPVGFEVLLAPLRSLRGGLWRPGHGLLGRPAERVHHRLRRRRNCQQGDHDRNECSKGFGLHEGSAGNHTARLPSRPRIEGKNSG
jgi:hypothetical protein